jgi:hypothetical protein
VHEEFVMEVDQDQSTIEVAKRVLRGEMAGAFADVLPGAPTAVLVDAHADDCVTNSLTLSHLHDLQLAPMLIHVVASGDPNDGETIGTMSRKPITPSRAGGL